jgi:hypothetical protein
MFFGDNEKMDRSLGSDVAEGEHLVVLVELLAGISPRTILQNRQLSGMMGLSW